MGGIRRRNFVEQPMESLTLDLSPQELTFQDALGLFLDDCKVRNLSRQTIRYYMNELKALRSLLREQGIDTPPHRLTKQMIQKHVIFYMLEVRQAKDTTINARLRAMRAFFNFLFDEGYLMGNPMRGIQLVKSKKRVIETFSKEQLNALLRQPNLGTFTGARDYTIMLLLLETGIRVKELVSLQIHDIQWSDNTILIRDGKGYKERLVPIQDAMKKQLKEWMRIRGTSIGEDALFLSIDNKPISIRQVQNQIRKYGKQAGIKNVRCSPHTFRHTFAKMCVKKGAGVFELQQILGHTSMEMVKVYVNLFSDDVKEKHREFSPVNQLIRTKRR